MDGMDDMHDESYTAYEAALENRKADAQEAFEADVAYYDAEQGTIHATPRYRRLDKMPEEEHLDGPSLAELTQRYIEERERRTIPRSYLAVFGDLEVLVTHSGNAPIVSIRKDAQVRVWSAPVIAEDVG